uniref:Transmembrane protein 231 n=1 Tax=Parascaris equorum TaxID=6256 RepID=A0A914S794_PAREQ
MNNGYLFPEMLNAFNFLYLNVNTMFAYKEEILAGDSRLLRLNVKTSGHAHTHASLDRRHQDGDEYITLNVDRKVLLFRDVYYVNITYILFLTLFLNLYFVAFLGNFL